MPNRNQIIKELSAKSDLFIIADLGGQVVYASPSMASLLGYTKSQMMGLTLDMLVPPDVHEWHRHMVREAILTKRRDFVMGNGGAIHAIHRSGTEIPLWASPTTCEDYAILVAEVVNVDNT